MKTDGIDGNGNVWLRRSDVGAISPSTIPDRYLMNTAKREASLARRALYVGRLLIGPVMDAVHTVIGSAVRHV